MRRPTRKVVTGAHSRRDESSSRFAQAAHGNDLTFYSLQPKISRARSHSPSCIVQYLRGACLFLYSTVKFHKQPIKSRSYAFCPCPWPAAAAARSIFNWRGTKPSPTRYIAVYRATRIQKPILTPRAVGPRFDLVAQS